VSTLTLTATGVPMDIPATGRAVSSTETGLGPYVITDVDVFVDVQDAQFVARLATTSGLLAQLLTANAASGVTRRTLTFDDDFTPPVTGRRVPETRLSVFDGTPPDTRWSLIIADRGLDRTAPPGTLWEWSLTLTLAEPLVVAGADGSFNFSGLLPGTYHIREDGQPDLIATAPATGEREVAASEGQVAAGLDLGARPRRLQVSSRHVFYNNSVFDGRDAGVNSADDGAIATDKSFLPAVQAPAAANVTSYTKGINGIMVDVAELLTPPTLADFSFKAPSPFDPSVFVDVPAPTGFAVRDLPGGDHLRRVTFIWPDNLLRNTWLQVGVLATPATRRLAPDFAYIANLVGKTDQPAATRVTARDLVATRGQLFSSRPVSVNNPYDFNRDGRVNALDLLAVRTNLGRSLGPFVPPATQAAPLRTQSAWLRLENKE
jgi:hypothetical protein